MGQKLVDAIRKAAGSNRQDNAKYYICEVLSFNSDDYTISVKPLTSLAADNIDNDYGGIENNYMSVKGTDAQLVDVANQMLTPLEWNNVALMVGVDDGLLLVPSIGSHVAVITSKYQNPMVIGFSELDQFSLSLKTTSSTLVYGETSDNSQIVQTSTQTNMIAQDSSLIGQINVLKDKINLVLSNNTQIILDDKINIQNSSASLYNMFIDILNILNDMAVAVIPTSTPTTLGTLNPAILTNISDLNTKNSSLFE